MTVDLTKHREAFLSESLTHIKSINEVLVALEKNPSDEKLFYVVFRAVHTLKSLSATMNYNETAELCHHVEDLLAAIAKNKVLLLDYSDLLFQCFDHLSANLESIAKDNHELSAKELIAQVALAAKGQKTERIDNAKGTSPTIDRIKSLEIKVEQLDALMNLAEELIVNQMHFAALRERIVQPELGIAVESLGRIITELQYRIMQMRLVPIDVVFNRFIRMTRDLAKSEGKQINLQITSSDIELDRVIIDQISESIGHLIRNAIDHGIESPSVRKQVGKEAEGVIHLTAARTKDAAIISVSDDGKGLDLERIKKIAISKGLITPSASKEAVKEVIFSQITTNEKVTEVSGRGLGLSIVKQKIQSVNGSITVESVSGQGTTFYMEIPITLAIIKALFVKVGPSIYAIPIEFVKRLLILNPDELKGLMQDEAILYEDAEIPILRLADLFQIPRQNMAKEAVVIVCKGDKQLGLAVDGLQVLQEIIIKPLSPALKTNNYFSGAAVVSSGQLILVLDVAYLLQHTEKPISLENTGDTL